MVARVAKLLRDNRRQRRTVKESEWTMTNTDNVTALIEAARDWNTAHANYRAQLVAMRSGRMPADGGDWFAECCERADAKLTAAVEHSAAVPGYVAQLERE